MTKTSDAPGLGLGLGLGKKRVRVRVSFSASKTALSAAGLSTGWRGGAGCRVPWFRAWREEREVDERWMRDKLARRRRGRLWWVGGEGDKGTGSFCWVIFGLIMIMMPRIYVMNRLCGTGVVM